MLHTTEQFVYRLVKLRPDILPSHANGHSSYKTVEVQAVARKYIFVSEIKARSNTNAAHHAVG